MAVLIEICLTAGPLMILLMSLDVLFGLTGRLSMAQGAFYGCGAYGLAILTKTFGVDYVTAMICTVAIAAIVAAFVGLLTSRTSNFHFAIATLAAGTLFVEFVKNVSWTGASSGIFGIRRPVIGDEVSDAEMAAISCALAVIVLFLVWALSRSRLGIKFVGVRDDEQLLETYGYNPRILGIVAFTISGALAGLAGGLYASSFRYISPESFTAHSSFNILIAYLIGGRGPLGAVLGAFLFTGFSHALTIPDLPGELAGTIPQLAFGLLLVIMIRAAPGGLSSMVHFWRKARPQGLGRLGSDSLSGSSTAKAPHRD